MKCTSVVKQKSKILSGEYRVNNKGIEQGKFNHRKLYNSRISQPQKTSASKKYH